MGLPKTIEAISKADLSELHTGTLLTRLQNLRKLPESFEASDMSAEEEVSARNKIAFKNTAVWKEAWSDLKEELSGREHRQRGNKERRQREAFEKENR